MHHPCTRAARVPPHPQPRGHAVCGAPVPVSWLHSVTGCPIPEVCPGSALSLVRGAKLSVAHLRGDWGTLEWQVAGRSCTPPSQMRPRSQPVLHDTSVLPSPPHQQALHAPGDRAAGASARGASAVRCRAAAQLPAGDQARELLVLCVPVRACLRCTQFPSGLPACLPAPPTPNCCADSGETDGKAPACILLSCAAAHRACRHFFFTLTCRSGRATGRWGSCQPTCR